MTPEFNQSVLALPVGDRDRIQGSATATITLVEYGDYQCFRCRQAHIIITTIQQQIQPLRFVYRHFPQPHLHPNAQRAAEAAEAAGTQGRFWQMHDTLFGHQQALTNGYLAEYALELGLDVTQFLREVSGHIHAAKIQEDYQSGVDSGVKGTPAFFINGVSYNGSLNLEEMLQALVAAG